MVNNQGTLLRETSALDPETGQPCPARVIERDGKVYLEKHPASGGTRSAMVERDAAFYKRFSSADVIGRHRIMNHFFYVTSKCNLKCPVCFEAKRDIAEPPLAALKAKLINLRGARIALCGAEPTCRDDLPDLIRVVNEYNMAVLMTNGIRLADMKYVRKLREAGLRDVIFALNGLNDEVCRRTNGEGVVDLKLKALENLAQTDIVVYLSSTITRGVNEDQIGQLLDLEKEMKCIFQVRFRSMAEMGDYIEGGQFFMSELVKVICREGGIDYSLWLKQQDFLDHLGRTIGIDDIRPRLCAMRAEMDMDLVPFASDREWQIWEKALLKRPRMLATLVRNWGPVYAFRYVLGSIRGGHRYTPHPRFRRLSVRVWPNFQTLDLDLNRRCTSLYLRDGASLPFCMSNCLRSHPAL